MLYVIGVKLLLLGEFGKIRQKISCQCGDLDHYALLDLIMSFQLGVQQSWVVLPGTVLVVRMLLKTKTL